MSPGAPPRWRWQHHAELASTQSYTMALAQGGEPGPLAVLAHRQTAGHGREGRGWVAPAGNLNLSLLLRPSQTTPEPGFWAMLAGVALHEALLPFASAGLRLKWPNDLMLDGAKLGGILIDSALTGEGRVAWLVIGLGANLRIAPNVPGRSTASLGAAAPPPAEAARRVVDALDRFAAQDMRHVLAAWLARAHPPGTPLSVQTAAGRVTAPFAGLDASGALLLDGIARPISSADVFIASRQDQAAHAAGR